MTAARWRPILARWEALLVLVLVGALVWGSQASSVFWDGGNFAVATSTFMEKAIMALPMTLLIVSGEIDLSVASILGLASAVMGKGVQHGLPLWLCIVLALAVGAACGLLNGLLVTRVGLPSLVVTLGTLGLFRGLASVVLGAQAVSSYPSWFNDFGYGTIPGTVIPWTLLIFLPLFALFAVVLHRGRIGRQIYALGINKEAARFSAVRVDRIKLWLYVVSGVIAALAGVIFTARVSSSRADNAVGFELDVIAAVLLGGVSIFGGRGTLFGVLLSLCVVATLRNGLALVNVDAAEQSLVVGGLLILSVLGPNLVAGVRRALRPARPGPARAAPGD